jgi:FkbM family methyltransferase
MNHLREFAVRARMHHAGGLLAAVWRHPANANRRVRSVVRLLAWQLMKHSLKLPVTIAFHDQRLKCYPDSTSTSAALYFSGYPDYWEMKFLQAYLQPGDNFLDVGANAGVYSMLAASYIGAQGRIDAFEPIEATALRIEEQAALNGLTGVRVHRCAVCDHDGDIDFGFSDESATMHLRRAADSSSRGQRVRGTTLDAFEPYLDYAVGKMDIEGAEPMALKGAAKRLSDANPPVWLLELAGYSTCYGISSDEVVRQLAEAGFDCTYFDPASATLQNATEPWTLGLQNVIAVASSRRQIVEQRLASRRSAPC